MQLSLLIIIIGAILLIFLVMNAIFSRFKLPPLVGYISLGWVVNFLGNHFDLLNPQTTFTFSLLGKIGVVLLLFHIGIESNLKKLLSVVGKAGFVALFEIFLSGGIAFFAAYALGAGMLASIIIGLALTATSIGVSSYSWGEKALNEKKEGSFLLDLASFDDIISILLLSILFGLIDQDFSDQKLFVTKFLFFIAKLILFVGGCYLFSHFAEKKIMTELIQYEKMPDSMLSIVGIGFLIAGIASLIEFSIVIGAFFAGIAFSRDPRSVRMDASMKSLLDFFVPFFFFWIGYQMTIQDLSSWWIFFLGLLAAAIFGKLLGVWLPGRWIKLLPKTALLLAVSMIPRAEVTMVIMDRAMESGWINQSEYSSVALVVLATCLFTPIATKSLLKKPPSNRSGALKKI